MDTLPTPTDLLMKKSTKIPKMAYHTAPPPRVDSDEEYKDKKQKLLSPIQTTPSSLATSNAAMATSQEINMTYHEHHTNTSGANVATFAVLGKNLQRSHHENVFIDPTNGASQEYRHLMKVKPKVIWENSFANEIVRLTQGIGARMLSGTNTIFFILGCNNSNPYGCNHSKPYCSEKVVLVPYINTDTQIPQQ